MAAPQCLIAAVYPAIAPTSVPLSTYAGVATHPLSALPPSLVAAHMSVSLFRNAAHAGVQKLYVQACRLSMQAGPNLLSMQVSLHTGSILEGLQPTSTPPPTHTQSWLCCCLHECELVPGGSSSSGGTSGLRPRITSRTTYEHSKVQYRAVHNSAVQYGQKKTDTYTSQACVHMTPPGLYHSLRVYERVCQWLFHANPTGCKMP
jgi:hypothetical protein